MTEDVSHNSSPPKLRRYARQVAYAPMGDSGQQRLLQARVAVVGCGALGSTIANTLVRAGVGYVRIIDRDFVELDNLQRQNLYDEEDLAASLPKAVAAAEKLRRINSAVEVDPRVADVNAQSADELLADVSLLLDGGDNFELRYLVNDYAVKERVPWIYGAALGGEGRVLPILPHQTPCMRCVFPETPAPGSVATCETAGVLGPAVGVTANLQAAAALKLLSGNQAALDLRLIHFDLWKNTFRELDISAAGPGGACPCCGAARFEFLEGERGALSAALCGRNAVQVLPPAAGELDFETVARALRSTATGEVTVNRFLLRTQVDHYRITLFRDGRAIIQGTDDPAQARSVYARYVGS